MPVYKVGSRITVPSSSGVLSDSQYTNLTPKDYRLDSAVTKCETIQKDVNVYIDTFLASYKTLVGSIDTNLGVDFFSINNQDLNIVDGSTEIEKATTTTDDVEGTIETIKSQMSSINDKLDEVESALSTMNSTYKTRKEAVDTAWKECNDFELKKPKLDSYDSDTSYVFDLTKWQSEYNRLEKTAKDLETQLKSDADKTYREIDISWFCSAKNGE